MQFFAAKGHGVIVPDLLGYGQSSKSSNSSDYRLKLMSGDIVELLDALKQDAVVGVGHDFGATLLSRAVTYHPERFLKVAFLSVGPPKMGTPFDLETINSMTERMLGYEMLGYISWLGRDPGAQQCLEQHAASAMSLVFCADHSQWNKWYRPKGKMRQFVEEDQRLAVGGWYPEHLQRRHLEAFGTTDGYKGAVKWYQMWTENLFAPDEVGFEDFKIQQPVLFIGDQDSGQQSDMLHAWAPRMSVATVNGGHWVHLEQATAVNETLRDFIEEA